MRIVLHQKDVFDIAQADTLVVPVDGSGPDLVGDVGRQLMVRMEVDFMHEFYAPPPSYPFNGDRHWSFLGYKNFNWLCVVGIFSGGSAQQTIDKALLQKALAKVIKDSYFAEVGRDLAFMPPVGPNQLRIDQTVGVIKEVCSDTRLQSKSRLERTFHLAAPQLEVFDAIKAVLG
mgnify:CR=1 FL=1